jgi:hypothetical protein
MIYTAGVVCLYMRISLSIYKYIYSTRINVASWSHPWGVVARAYLTVNPPSPPLILIVIQWGARDPPNNSGRSHLDQFVCTHCLKSRM